PDYSVPEYWMSRFQKEIQFEWLGSGDIILPHVAREFGQTPNAGGVWSPGPTGQNTSQSWPTKILHVGSGTSHLSLSLRSLVPARIINIDFVQNCLTQLRQSELDAFGDVKMEYEQLDILSWEHVRSQLRRQEGEERILIIDKATSDAIACGPDRSSPFSLCPEQPVRILILHLAALSMPGSIWLAFSCSTSRFDDVGELWNIEHTEKVPAESGQTKEGIWAPEIWHTLFVLRR
ncbi:hypothetical protein B0J17DRAFT_535434, partial [Rhizoctonia solani]